jgi:hypothetical protein
MSVLRTIPKLIKDINIEHNATSMPEKEECHGSQQSHKGSELYASDCTKVDEGHMQYCKRS